MKCNECGQDFDESQKVNTPPQSTTPRTDALVKQWSKWDVEQPTESAPQTYRDFARTLERELNEANIKITFANDAAQKGEHGRNLGAAYEECQKELSELKKQMKELKEVALEMYEALHCNCQFGNTCTVCKAKARAYQYGLG